VKAYLAELSACNSTRIVGAIPASSIQVVSAAAAIT